MPYRIRITDTAKLDLRRLPGHVRQNIRRVIERLGDKPIPAQAKELRGLPGRYRIRLLTWRIIYRVDAETILVLTVRQKTGPRRTKISKTLRRPGNVRLDSDWPTYRRSAGKALVHGPTIRRPGSPKKPQSHGQNWS